MHFRNESWLKAAALYWDQVNRIVPDEMQGITDDSSTVEKLKGEIDFVHDISPGWEAGEITEPFCQSLIRIERMLREKYSIKNKDAWPTGQTSLRKVRNEPLPDDFDTRLAYVQPGKMTPEICEYLVDADLALHFDQFEFDKQWLGMHPDLADAYMTTLTRRVATNGHMHPLTDSEQNHAAVAELTVDDIVAMFLSNDNDQKVKSQPDLHLDVNELKSTYLQMAFDVVVPADLENTPVEKIIELRNGDYSQAFRAFQESIHKLVSSEQAKAIAGMKNLDARRAHIANEFRREIKEPMERLERSMKPVVGNTAHTVLNVAVQLVQASAKGALALGSKALGLIPPIQQQQEKTKERVRSSPEGYLLHIKEGLQPATSMDSVLRWWRRFSTGV